jgi:hypothetical protein
MSHHSKDVVRPRSVRLCVFFLFAACGGEPSASPDAGARADSSLPDSSAPDASFDGGSDAAGGDAAVDRDPDAGESSLLVACDGPRDCGAGEQCQFEEGVCDAGYCRPMPCVSAMASFELCDGTCVVAPANCPPGPFVDRFADASCGTETLPDEGTACERYARETCRIEAICRVSYMEYPAPLIFRGPYGARALFGTSAHLPDDAACLTNALAHCTDRLALPDVGLDESDVVACVGDLRALRSCAGARDHLARIAPRTDRNERYTSLPYCPTAPGTRAEGDGCAVDEQCASGLCSRIYNLAARIDRCGTCARIRGEGEVCGLDPDEEEDGWFPCGDGLGCMPDARGVPRCTRLVRELGEACGGGDTFGLCAGGLACIRGVCAPERRVGETCTELIGECRPGAYCDDRIGRCVYLPEVGLGGVCGITFPPTPGFGLCAEGVCDDHAMCWFPAESSLGASCETTACDFICPKEFQIRPGEADVCRRFTELSCDADTPPQL